MAEKVKQMGAGLFDLLEQTIPVGDEAALNPRHLQAVDPIAEILLPHQNRQRDWHRVGQGQALPDGVVHSLPLRGSGSPRLRVAARGG